MSGGIWKRTWSLSLTDYPHGSERHGEIEQTTSVDGVGYMVTLPILYEGDEGALLSPEEMNGLITILQEAVQSDQ